VCISKKPLPAKDRILEAAIELMKKTGLTGAGINQILALSRAPKGSLYYYFPGGKDQIIAEALALYSQRVATAFDQVLSREQTPAEKIRILFRFVADRFESGSCQQSCAAGAVTLDLDEAPALQKAAAMAFASWKETVARHLRQSRIANAEALAGVVLSTIEGAYVRGRAEASKQAFLEAGETLATLIQKKSRRSG
jgi:TetR/AcrR family transcriptional regulator, lmrAB and yxaGH operons repressor